MIESAKAATIGTFSAAVREARRTLFSLLQRQPAGAMANVADSGPLAVRTFLVIFSHGIPLSSLRSSLSGTEDKNKCCDCLAGCARWSYDNAGISLLHAEIHAENADALLARHPNR